MFYLSNYEEKKIKLHSVLSAMPKSVKIKIIIQNLKLRIQNEHK